MPEHEPQCCPRCARVFECRANAIQSCPCIAVQLSPEAREYIAQRWDDCLCPQCLQELNGEAHWNAV